VSRKLALIAGVSFIHLMLFLAAGYFLFTSRSVGVTPVWDESARLWKVESAEPWSPLQTGDLIERIGGIDIGPLHLLGCVKNLRNRNEVSSWFDARTLLFRELHTSQIPCVVIRGPDRVTVSLTPRMTRWHFLYGIESLPLLVGFFCFITGTVVLHKKGSDEQSLTLFLLCSSYFVCAICYTAWSSNGLFLEPRFDYFINALTAVGLLLSGVFLLHIALLLPTRKVVLNRFPLLPLPAYAAAVLIGAILEVRVVNVMMTIFLSLTLITLGHSFLTCRKPVAREQLKWIGAGFVFGLSPYLGLSIIPLALTGHELVGVGYTSLAVCLILLSIAFAIRKYRLMEIDAFLEGTFVYAVTLALLGAIDLSLTGFFSSRFGHVFEIRPAGKLFITIVMTIMFYAAIRDRVRLYLRKLVGRHPLDEQAILLAFTETVSGHPPASILKLWAAYIQEIFKPASLTLVEKANDIGEGILALFRGLSAPVSLWQSPLQKEIPEGDSFYLALPLSRDGEAECVMLLGELPESRLYSTHELGILHSLLREAKLLYENARLHEDNLKHCRLMIEEEKRHLREKEKIVRDLHDGIGGITTNINVLSEIAAKSSSPSIIRNSLSTISDLSREGLTEIRTFMHSLDDGNLSWRGLASDLRSSGTKIIEPNGIAFELDTLLDDAEGRPGSLLFLNILRIYREALTNIVKHSGATRVKVRLEVGPAKVLLSVEDDGVGFEVDQSKRGRGLSNMCKRAADIGGTLSLRSDSGVAVLLEAGLPRTS
jgi:signal transduction histidine kinase